MQSPWVLLISALVVFVKLGNINRNCMLTHSIFFFIEFLKVVLIKVIATLIMSAKLSTPGLLESEVCENKDYKVIIFVHDVTNKILFGNSNFVVNVVIWSLVNLAFVLEQSYKLQFYNNLERKIDFLRGSLDLCSII